MNTPHQTLKMCQEITELKMTVRRLEIDLIREKEKTAAVVDSAAQDMAGYGMSVACVLRVRA
jgi:hypothetical protein